MTEKEIAEKFLSLFSRGWEDPTALQGFRELRQTVSEHGQWPAVIDARLMALEKKTAESISLLKEILVQEPHNCYASLLLAAVLSHDIALPEEAIRICDALLLKDFADQALPDWLEALTLGEKVVSLFMLKIFEDAQRVADEMVDRFGNSVDPPLERQVARALINKGGALRRMGMSDAAIGVYEGVVQRFGGSEDVQLREAVARALLLNTLCLLEAERIEEARALFSRVERDYMGSEELRSKLASLYAGIHSYVVSRGETKEERPDAELGKTALDITRKDLVSNLRVYLNLVLEHVDRSRQEKYFKRMKATKERTDRFISDDSLFSSDFSFLLVLREWNSYTPVIPAEEEADRGGGYFIRSSGEGIAIDPGYDFIENLHRAGGRLCDINHVIVTHAHDDHTAELEALLMLLQRRWKTKDLKNKKRVSLYLSAGVQRKFAGLLDLHDPKYRGIVTLGPAEKGFEQRLRLNSATELTVLPAYHDDVITPNSAVGLAFEFTVKGGDKRRVVFTSDSGLYPLKVGADGKKMLYDDNEETPIPDVVPEKALYNRYPETCLKPDLLVAHIGSIKESEFKPEEELGSPEDEGRWYYVNHLGLLGTLTMLHQLNPATAVIGEFGSELKGFHFELVQKLQQALHDRQKSDAEERLTFVIPGDLTIAYDITNHRFLCHDTCEFADPEDLCCRQAVDCQPKWNDTTERFEALTKEGTTRTYLFGQKEPLLAEPRASRCAQDYCARFFNHDLPYHKDRSRK